MASSSGGDGTEKPVNVPLSLKLIGLYLAFVNKIVYKKDGTVNRKLGDFLDPKAAPRWANGVLTIDVTIDTATGHWVRIFEPKKDAPKNACVEHANSTDSNSQLPVIIFFHGGGFIGLAPHSQPYDTFCRKISKSANAVVISVFYRLAPEHRCPTAYDDCFKVFGWLQSPDSQTHIPKTANLSRCFLMGDSAGANIVHFVGSRAAQSDIAPVELKGLIEIQPFFGGEERTKSELHMKPPILPLKDCHWAWAAFAPPGENRDHPNINVLGPKAADISGVPLAPVLLVTGGFDILKDRQASYVEKMRAMGKDVTVIDYPGAHHAFYVIETNKPLSNQFMEDVCNYIRTR